MTSDDLRARASALAAECHNEAHAQDGRGGPVKVWRVLLSQAAATLTDLATALEKANERVAELERRLTIIRDDARKAFGLGLMPWLLEEGKASDTAMQLSNILSGWHAAEQRLAEVQHERDIAFQRMLEKGICIECGTQDQSVPDGCESCGADLIEHRIALDRALPSSHAAGKGEGK